MFQNTPDNLHNFVHSLWDFVRYVQLYDNANASDGEAFSTCSDATTGQQQRKGEINYEGKTANIRYKSTFVVGSGLKKGIHLGTHPWTDTDI